MQDERANARCSKCGREGRRDDFFGAEPELLCDGCAQGVRQRMAPAPAGKMENLLKHRPVVTVGMLGAAVVLFVVTKGYKNPSQWSSIAGLWTMIQMVPGTDYVKTTVMEQPWRLLTSAFLHIGFFHILFNAWWIWDLGRAIELRRGPLTMAALVVGSAVTASALQWMFGGPGVGLSGVVYGLAAFLFAQRRVDPVAAAVMNPRTTRFLAAWLVIGVVLAQMKIMPIGNWAHGGGAAWGLLAGVAWQGRLRWLWVGLLAVVTIALVIAVTQVVPGWYLEATGRT